MKLIFKNKNLIEFITILIVSIILCYGFICMHYTTDTYKIADEGYNNYAVKWSFKDGRIIMFVLLEICEVLNLPIKITNFIFTLTGIFISCIGVLIIKNIVLDIKNINSKKKEIFILLLSYFIIFNFMYIEAIYFLEIIIISISILLFILATKCILNKEKYYTIKALILTVIGVISYQGTLSFFIAFSISMLVIKYQKNIKEEIKDFFTILFISIISVIIGIVVVKITSSYVGIAQNRFNIDNIIYNLQYIINNFDTILINSCGIVPQYSYMLCLLLICAFSCIHIKMSEIEGNKHIIRIFIITTISICSCFAIFLATLSSLDCGRMYVALGSIPSLILIYVLINTNVFEGQNIKLKIIYLIVIVWIIINITAYIIKINESRQKNKLEKEYCLNIYNYCIQNNLVLEKAGILPLYIEPNEIYFEQIKTRNKMNINEIRGYQSAISGFNVNIGSNLTEIKLNDEIIKKYLEEIESGHKGINETYTMYIDNILVMPAFIW